MYYFNRQYFRHTHLYEIIRVVTSKTLKRLYRQISYTNRNYNYFSLIKNSKYY